MPACLAVSMNNHCVPLCYLGQQDIFEKPSAPSLILLITKSKGAKAAALAETHLAAALAMDAIRKKMQSMKVEKTQMHPDNFQIAGRDG